MQCLVKLGLKPKETIIVEDSHYGRISAQDSGCHLMPIKQVEEVNLRNIKKYINSKKNDVINKDMNAWEDKEMNVLIPMAGAGSRFQSAGYTFPKPLIDVRNKPMIQVVAENLNIKANYIYIVQKQHREKYNC